MKKALVFAATAVICTSSATFASGQWNPALDEVIVINGGDSFFLEDEDILSFSFELDNPNSIVGFSFAGVWEGTGGAWASDTILRITAPDGTMISRGGFPAPGGEEDWDFQGDVSSAPGLYVHGLGSNFGDGNPDFAFDKIAKTGTWTFEFEQTWGTANWKGVSIILHKAPAPGVLALLGIAGLAGSRRRRA